MRILHCRDGYPRKSYSNDSYGTVQLRTKYVFVASVSPFRRLSRTYKFCLLWIKTYTYLIAHSTELTALRGVIAVCFIMLPELSIPKSSC